MPLKYVGRPDPHPLARFFKRRSDTYIPFILTKRLPRTIPGDGILILRRTGGRSHGEELWEYIPDEQSASTGDVWATTQHGCMAGEHSIALSPPMGHVVQDLMGAYVGVEEGVQSSRGERLNGGRCLTLYHQTDVNAASAIMASGKMRRGSSGLAGGGIYFAVCIADTDRKTTSPGPVLECRVKVGNVKTISPNGDPTITFQSLLEDGYDSVLIPRGGGDEHVIYNWDQIEVVGYVRGASSLRA